MARLTQSELSGFRLGTSPTDKPEAARDAPPSRDAAELAVRRATRNRTDRHSHASAPGSCLPSAPSPLGPVPTAPSRTEPRHKIGLTLPLELAEKVRVLTAQGYTLADLVMVAYQDQRDRLLHESQAITSRRLVRRPQGRCPLTIALACAERAALDELAEHLDWTRSQTVAALLDSQLGSGPSPR